MGLCQYVSLPPWVPPSELQVPDITHQISISTDHHQQKHPSLAEMRVSYYAQTNRVWQSGKAYTDATNMRCMVVPEAGPADQKPDSL